MCTNESDILYEYDFKDPQVVDELKTLNNFIEILYKVGDKWIKECYVRSQLLDAIIPNYQDATTLWGDGTMEQRVKMVAKLPLTGEFILERSVRYLANPRFTSFLKYDCSNRKVGSYFGVSTLHGAEQSLCRLVPIEEDDGDNSFRVSVEGESPKQYSQMLGTSTNMTNPVDPNDKKKGFFIGEIFYYKNELNYYLNNFSNMMRGLQSSIEQSENRSMDETIMMTIIPKILYRIDKIINGKQHFNALRIELNFIKPSLRSYREEMEYMENIESLLNNNTIANPNGYGEWIYFNNIISGK